MDGNEVLLGRYAANIFGSFWVGSRSSVQARKKERVTDALIPLLEELGFVSLGQVPASTTFNYEMTTRSEFLDLRISVYLPYACVFREARPGADTLERGWEQGGWFHGAVERRLRQILSDSGISLLSESVLRSLSRDIVGSAHEGKTYYDLLFSDGEWDPWEE